MHVMNAEDARATVKLVCLENHEKAEEYNAKMHSVWKNPNNVL